MGRQVQMSPAKGHSALQPGRGRSDREGDPQTNTITLSSGLKFTACSQFIYAAGISALE